MNQEDSTRHVRRRLTIPTNLQQWMYWIYILWDKIFVLYIWPTKTVKIFRWPTAAVCAQVTNKEWWWSTVDTLLDYCIKTATWLLHVPLASCLHTKMLSFKAYCYLTPQISARSICTSSSVPGKHPLSMYHISRGQYSSFYITYAIYIPGKRTCGPKSWDMFKRPWVLTRGTTVQCMCILRPCLSKVPTAGHVLSTHIYYWYKMQARSPTNTCFSSHFCAD
jgi:hypothetical protein